MNKIVLEDCHYDILAKAMRGIGIGKNQLAKRIGVEKSVIHSVLSGEVKEKIISLMARELGLDEEKLLISTRRDWSPTPLEINGLEQFNQAFDGMQVNTYIMWDEVSLSAWLFDTGATPEVILEFINAKKLQLDAIFLTHTHRDHVANLHELKQATKHPPVFVHQLEALDDCELIREGFTTTSGSMTVDALHTHGHSVGGLSYVISGLPCPVAIVGDAIFAGSMGGGIVSYQDALRTNRDKIMTLPDETVLCPGHGPITTVKEEKEHNPFFPEF